MAGSIRPTRQEVTRQFPVLGFTVRTARRPAWFEVALATDPALFESPEGRTAGTFYSSRAEGPLPAPAGEAVYLVPQRVLARFVGKEKLYYALATYGEASFRDPQVVRLPAGAVPYVHVSRSYTGEVRGSLGRGALEGAYGTANGPLTWGGDEARAGSMEPAPAASPRPSSGDGRPAPPGAASGPPSGDGASAALAYDDGFGTAFWTHPHASAMTSDIPLDPGPGGRSIGPDALAPGDLILSTTTHVESWAIRRATGSLVSHAMLYLGGGRVAEAIREGVVVRTLAAALDEAVLAVAYRHPALSSADARRAVDYAQAQEGLPYNVDFRAAIRYQVTGTGAPDLEPGDADSFFCSQLVLEAYRQAGSPLTTTPPDWNSPENLAQLALARRLQYVGHLKSEVTTGELSYRGPARAFTAGSSLDALLDRLRQRGFSEDQLARVEGEARATTQALARGQSYSRALEGSGRATLPELSTSGWAASLVQAAVEEAQSLFPSTWGAFLSRLRAGMTGQQVTVGIGLTTGIGGGEGLTGAGGFVISSTGEFGFYGTVGAVVGAVASADLFGQVTVVGGGLSAFGGLSLAYTVDGGEGLGGGVAVLFTVPGHDFLGISVQIGATAGSPVELYLEAQATYVQRVGSLGYQGAPARPLEAERVPERNVSCAGYPRDYPIFQVMGTDDPVGVIRQAVDKAVEVLDATIGELEHARGRIVDEGQPAAWPTISDHTAASLRTRMLLDPADPAVWTGEGPRTVFFLVRWLKNIRKILAGGQIKYTCIDGDCSSSSQWGAAIPGEYRIYLCRRWWRGDAGQSDDVKLLNRASTLIHEASHIYYSTQDDTGRGIWRADCLEQLVSDLSGQHMPAAFEESCGPADLTQAQAYADALSARPHRGDGRGGPAPGWALATQSFDVNWTDVQLVPQPTSMSCWAAAAAMVVGWRDRVSVDPAAVASGSGFWSEYTSGLWPRDHDDMGRAWGLVVEPPQSYSVDGLRALIERNGPLWIGLLMPSGSHGFPDAYGHAVVVTGLYGDGTPGGTKLRILDPLPEGTGSRYELSLAEFARRYESRLTVEPDGSVNVQVLHAGGRSGGASAQGLGYAARALAAGQHARAMAGEVEIASAIAGAVMTAITSNTGDIALRLEQLRGKKTPGDDAANEGAANYQNRTISLTWPKMATVLGADEIYADLQVDWDYNGRTVANVRVTDTNVNDAVGMGLDVDARIIDDARVYVNGSGETMAGVKVQIRYRFTNALYGASTVITDLTLYGDGRHLKRHRTTAYHGTPVTP